jgi:hypothetical protein
VATEAGIPPANAAPPDADGLRELVDWTSRFGIISACFDAEPGDRSERWRIELRDGLRALAIPDDDPDRHERRQALRREVERFLDRLRVDGPPSGGRTRVGYIDLGDGGERWYSSQLPLRRFDVVLSARPHLRPLVELADQARRLAVAVLSSERIRVLDFAGGWTEEVAEFELETFELDWRERKAPQIAQPTRGQGTSSSGKDQFGQRLEANRERFVKDAGAQIASRLAERERSELLVFGERALAGAFIEGIKDGIDARCVEDADLISAPTHLIAERVVEALPQVDRARQLALAERAVDHARAGGRASVGIEETAQALAQGRADHLLIDAERDLGAHPELAAPLGIDEEATADIAEWMIEAAIRTSARITPLRDEAAAALAEQEGVAALLRY